MKNRDAILSRLNTLRNRFVLKYVSASVSRKHRNCSYNYEHVPTPRPPTRRSIEPEISPSRVVSLVVIQPDSPIRVCTYGSDDLVNWSGDICDKDDIAQHCPKFKPSVSQEEVSARAHALLADDKWVFENMKDVAALQWVIGDRIYRHRPSLLERILLWIKIRFLKVPPVKARPPFPDIPSSFWDEPDDPPLGS